MKNPLNAWFASPEDENYVRKRWKRLTRAEKKFLEKAWTLRQEALNTNMAADVHDRLYNELVQSLGLSEQHRARLYDVWMRGRPELSHNHPHFKERK